MGYSSAIWLAEGRCGPVPGYPIRGVQLRGPASLCHGRYFFRTIRYIYSKGGTADRGETSILTDNQLMAAVREGNTDCLGQLFERHHRKLYNYFLKHIADRPASEDMVQDVFLRILQYRRTYNDGEFGIWLYTIARNVRHDHYRRRGRRLLPFDDKDTVEDPSPRPDSLSDTADDIAVLDRALKSLSDTDRDIIVMSRYHDMKYRDIGLVLGIAEAAVKMRAFRALKKLAAAFNSMKGENTP